MENRTEAVTTYRIGKATVRIHPGKMTAEEQREAFEKASRRMRREMERGRKKVESTQFV